MHTHTHKHTRTFAGAIMAGFLDVPSLSSSLLNSLAELLLSSLLLNGSATPPRLSPSSSDYYRAGTN